MIPTQYKGQYVAFATKHYKEDVIIPYFRKYLEATLIVPWIDTDTLGTFSGEVERPGNAMEVVEKKARLAMKAAGLPYGLASEGSFGPHPHIPFLASDQEILLFIDERRGFKLHEVLISVKTNFIHQCITSYDEVRTFLEAAMFPSHALIIRPNNWTDKKVIFKGVRDENDLRCAIAECLKASSDGKAWLETDMRANVNPSRMKVIGELAERLAKRLATNCPSCFAPGWGCTKFERGLPCEYCGLPTEMVEHEVFGCVLCKYVENKQREDGITKAEQMYCGVCNP